MFRAAIRSLLARKVRLILTGLAVVLGVGFMAGTFVLTDTMTRAFNDLVDTGYAPIDVLVRSSNAFTAQTSSLEERDPMPESVLQDVAAGPRRRARQRGRHRLRADRRPQRPARRSAPSARRPPPRPGTRGTASG